MIMTIKKLLKKRWTKWLPLGNFNYAGVDFIVFVKANRKTGMMRFKTVRVNSRNRFSNNVHQILPADLISVRKQWEAIKDELIPGDDE